MVFSPPSLAAPREAAPGFASGVVVFGLRGNTDIISLMYHSSCTPKYRKRKDKPKLNNVLVKIRVMAAHSKPKDERQVSKPVLQKLTQISHSTWGMEKLLFIIQGVAMMMEDGETTEV